MKYFLFLFVLLYGCKEPSAKPTDCTKFRTGDFVLEGTEKPYRITRTANTQTEKDLGNGFVYKFNIHWTDDCTYTLTFLETTDKKVREYHKVTVKIVKIEGNSYYYNTSIEGSDYTSSAKIRKLD